MTTTGRNSPCPCGSGKKYERALLPADDAQSVQRALSKQWHNLADVLDRHVYDPAMIRDVRDAAQVALS
jgi:hypothetical protein